MSTIVKLFQGIGEGIDREKQWLHDHLKQTMDSQRCFDCAFGILRRDVYGCHEVITCRKAAQRVGNSCSVHIEIHGMFQSVCSYFQPIRRDGRIVVRQIYNSSMFEPRQKKNRLC